MYIVVTEKLIIHLALTVHRANLLEKEIEELKRNQRNTPKTAESSTPTAPILFSAFCYHERFLAKRQQDGDHAIIVANNLNIDGMIIFAVYIS